MVWFDVTEPPGDWLRWSEPAGTGRPTTQKCNGETEMPETSSSPAPEDDVDPKVAELVVAIRDRFGLRGLRGARWLIDKEITIAEDALSDLSAD